MMGQNKTRKCGFGFFFRVKGPLISDWKFFSLHIFPSPDDLYKGEHTFFGQTVHQTEKVRPGYETKLLILDYISRRHFSIRCTVRVLRGGIPDKFGTLYSFFTLFSWPFNLFMIPAVVMAHFCYSKPIVIFIAKHNENRVHSRWRADSFINVWPMTFGGQIHLLMY